MSSSRCFEEDQKQNFFHPPNYWKMKKMMKNSKRYSQTRRASLGAIYKDAAPQPQGHEFNDESYNLWGHMRPNVV